MSFRLNRDPSGRKKASELLVCSVILFLFVCLKEICTYLGSISKRPPTKIDIWIMRKPVFFWDWSETLIIMSYVVVKSIRSHFCFVTFLAPSFHIKSMYTGGTQDLHVIMTLTILSMVALFLFLCILVSGGQFILNAFWGWARYDPNGLCNIWWCLLWIGKQFWLIQSRCLKHVFIVMCLYFSQVILFFHLYSHYSIWVTK